MKKYYCNWCDTGQKKRDSQITREPIEDRMATALFAICVKCKKKHMMIPASKEY